MSPPIQGNMPQSAWRVTGQVETLEAGPGGALTRGVRVSFTTAKGVDGSVFIPDGRYSPANVQAAIAPYAHQLDEVHGLAG